MCVDSDFEILLGSQITHGKWVFLQGNLESQTAVNWEENKHKVDTPEHGI